jgi:adenine phosphoribosyltransferase
MASKKFKVLLTSTSSIKQEAIKQFFTKEFNAKIDITTFVCKIPNFPEQPYLVESQSDSGYAFPKERMNKAKEQYDFDDFDYVVSIENCIVHLDKQNTLFDKCYALIYDRGLLARGESYSIKIFSDVTDLLLQQTLKHYNKKIQGFDKTAGEIIHESDPSVDPKNWVSSVHGIDRKDQICFALHICRANLNELHAIKSNLLSKYKEYDDWPKKGVVYEDPFPLFKDAKTLRQMVKFIVSQYMYDDIDYVIGLESRGFCLGTTIAYKLGAGFIPNRKVNKLPGEVIKKAYKKEYGEDICEMQVFSGKGSRVLIIDDLAATGGSLEAACELAQELGCFVVDCCVLRDVPQLKNTPDYVLKENCTILLQKI